MIGFTLFFYLLNVFETCGLSAFTADKADSSVTMRRETNPSYLFNFVPENNIRKQRVTKLTETEQSNRDGGSQCEK